ncbi:MAG: AAA family ATPase, partial [Planctomycetes bacterium]|nr:AAA family ATPase [Planctomycetota bacterium]
MNRGSTSSVARAEDHFERLARLLELESRAEAEQAVQRARKLSPAKAEATGNSLVDLVIADESSGLGGRILLRLAKRQQGLRLPWHRLSVGTPVLLSGEGVPPSPGRRGIVSDRTEGSIEVAFDSMPADADEPDTWRLDLSYDEIARLRQRAALQQAQTARGNRLAELRKVLLGERAAEFARPTEIEPLNASLNTSQRQAVEFALTARDIALVHGPPGTGKTTAVVELIRQAVRRGEKVLACAPSNLGVDNLLERLAAAGERVVRLGHPARVLPELRERTLDLLVENHPDVRLARKLVREALQWRRKAARYTRAKPQKGAKREMRAEAGALLADARRLEKAAVAGILDAADVLCATTTGLDNELLGERKFHLSIIDEACQSTEPGCWLPLLRAERAVLAGD